MTQRGMHIAANVDANMSMDANAATDAANSANAAADAANNAADTATNAQ